MEGHTILSHGQQRRKKNVQKSATELQLFHIIFCSHHDTQNSCSLRHSTSIHNVSVHSVLQKDHQSTSFKCVLMFEGLVKSIGVSNYTVDHLEELLQYSTVTPAVLQVLSPSHLNISMHLLCAVFHTFPSVVIRRKCSTNQELLS